MKYFSLPINTYPVWKKHLFSIIISVFFLSVALLSCFIYRKIVPNHFLLVPGVGAQGGSLEEVCKYGMTPTCGLIVNSSRAIIYADNSERYAEVAAENAQQVQKQMAELLEQYGI